VTHREQLISWLNDAHAMESQLLPILRSHAHDSADLPDAKRRIERHIGETETHVKRMEQAVSSLGSSPSSIKSGAASALGTVEGASARMFSAEAMRNAVNDYAAEQFEVATYKALILAAERAGEQEVARLCRENLREDEEMAKWLDTHLSEVVNYTIQHAA